MAIVVNSKFRPFSMDEMLKVVMPAAQMQKETEDALGEIDALSSVWEKLKDSEIDRDVYQQYQNFQNGLNQSIDDVYKNGVNANTRRALNKMRSRYAKEIAPIEEAWNRRNALAEEQRKAMLNDDSLLRQRVAGNIGLREIMNNPSMDYGRMVSGNKLTARVAQSASALANEYSKNPAKLNELLGGDYLEYVKDRGYSKESILAAMTDLLQNNASNAPEELKQIVYNVVNSSGIDSSWNDDAYTKAMAYAAEGLWQAIGKDEAQIMQNWRQNAMVQNSLAMKRDAANSDRELNKLYLTQTAVPYMKKDGTVGYYEPITRTKNSNGGYDYRRNELPDDAVPGNPKGGNNPINPSLTNPDGTVRSQVGNFKDSKDSNTLILNNQGVQAKDFADGKANTISKIEAKGFKVAKVVVAMENGNYQWANPGKDLGNNNTALELNANGEPIFVNPDSIGAGFRTTAGESKYPFGSTTDSNAVSNWGNLIKNEADNDKPLKYVSEAEFNALPVKTKAALMQSVKGMTRDYSNHQFVVFKVEGDDGKDSYVTFIPD